MLENSVPLGKYAVVSAPTAMSAICSEQEILLFHISTDYVFKGTGKILGYISDPIAPQNAHKRRKLSDKIVNFMAIEQIQTLTSPLEI